MNKKYINMLGIFLILVIYLVSGINKVFTFNNVATSINKLNIFNKLGLTISKLALLIIILIWTFGSLFLLYCKYTDNNLLGKYISSAFIIFTLIITLYYHFPSDKSQTIHFMKNLAIIGGLINIYSSFIQ